MKFEITTDELGKIVREEVAKLLQNERPLLRAQILEEMKFVTAETGVRILEIEGKQPLRSFHRLMTKHGVHFVKLGGVVRWKLRGEHSIEKLLSRYERAARAQREGRIVTMEGSSAA